MFAKAIIGGLLVLAIARPGPHDDRIFFDALFDTLDHVQDPSALPREQCDTVTGANRRLCDALILERESELTRVQSTERRAEGAFERSVLDQPRSTVAWYGLGLIRLQLARDTVFSRGGAEMPPGVSYLTGAANAFSQSVELDRTFARAVAALATTPVGRDGERGLGKRVNILRSARQTTPPMAVLAVAELERANGSVDSAIALDERALAAGAVDSGLASLAYARDLYAKGAASLGRAVLIRGAGTPTAASHAGYRAQLSFVATPEELAAWDRLAAAERSVWIADFWQKRDIAEGRKDGARLVEHYKRLEYALKNFRVTLPQTGRQRILSYMASYFDPTQSMMDRALHDPSCGTDMATYAQQDRSIGSHASRRDYAPAQDLIDDRGVIWIRHGPPDHRAISITSEAAEVWRYDRSPTPLVLQFHETLFNGSTGASTLTSTLVTMPPATRAQLCGAETSLCIPGDDMAALTAHLASRRPNAPCVPGLVGIVKPEVVQQARDTGLVQLAAGTTTDSYRRNFTHVVTPAVQVFGLARTDGGQLQIVAAYAVPTTQLAATPLSGGRAYTYSIQLMASGPGGRRIDIDTSRTIRADSAAGNGQYLSGLVVMPASAGLYHVSLVITQSDGRGAVARIGMMAVPDTSAAFSISSLVTGVEHRGPQWNSGDMTVAFNPGTVFQRGESAQLYFQLFGMHPSDATTMQVQLYKANAPVTTPPVFTVSESMAIRTARVEIMRSLDLDRIEPGRYRVRIVVTSAGKQLAAVASITVER